VLESGSAEAQLEELKARIAAVEGERDEYKRVYVALLEAYRKLEAGLLGQKRERFAGGEGTEQLALSLLSMLVGRNLSTRMRQRAAEFTLSPARSFPELRVC
jgi:hypothetical protein